MKKMSFFMLLCGILGSVSGCIGDQSSQSEATSTEKTTINYITPENKQQVAKALWNEEGPLAPDFFEKANYVIALHNLLEKGFDVLGNNKKQQIFWSLLVQLRASYYVEMFLKNSQEDPNFLLLILAILQQETDSLYASDPKETAAIYSDLLQYEELHPYDFAQAVQNQVQQIEEVTTENFHLTDSTILGFYSPHLKAPRNRLMQSFAAFYAGMSGLSVEQLDELLQRKGNSTTAKISPDELAQLKQAEMERLQQFSPAEYEKLRKGKIDFIKEYIHSLEITGTEENVRNNVEEKLEIANYSLGFTAPTNFPAELFFAEFVVDPANDDARIAVRPSNAVEPGEWTFSKHRFSSESEKPLPCRIDLVWYSVAENKSYSLQAELPFEKMKELTSLLTEYQSLDFVFGLAPYGTVALWANHPQTYETIELAHFQAEPIDLSFEDFAKAGNTYQASNWDEFRAKSLEKHSKAQSYLQSHPLPAPGTYNQFQQRYNTAWQVVFPSENMELEKISVSYFNGETEALTPQNLQQYALRGKPKELSLWYKENGRDEYTAYLYVSYQDAQDNAASHAVYQQVFGDNPNRQGLLQLSFNNEKNAWQLSLSADGKTQQIPQEEIRFKNNFSCYTSPVFYQPQSPWKASNQPTSPSDSVKEIPPEKRNEELAHALTVSDYEIIAQLLPAQGIDPNYQDAKGRTLLSLAIQYSNDDQVKELVRLGADVNLREPASGFPPIALAAMDNRAELVKLFLDSGADMQAQRILYGQETGENALSLAEQNHADDAASVLRQAGAVLPAPLPTAQPQATNEPIPSSLEINQPDASGFTPLMLAVMSGNTERISQLLDAGADVNITAPNIGSPLMFAAAAGNLDLVRKLIQAGANLNAKNETGMTPLTMACSQGSVELVKILVEAGADVNLPYIPVGQTTGMTPLQLANNLESKEIANILKQAGAHE